MVLKVLPVSLVLPAHKVPQVLQGQLVLRVLQAKWDQLVLRVLPEKLVLPDLRVLQV